MGDIPANWYEPHWVYWLFDAEGHLLYIGMTRIPAARFSRWRKSRTPWFPEVVRVDWRQYENHWEAARAEERDIKRMHPRHNKIFNADRRRFEADRARLEVVA